MIFPYTIHRAPTLTSLARCASPSIIDLTLTSGINPDRILAWNIDKDLIPDHAICSLYINLTAGQPQPKRFWAKTNWKIFEETIKESGMDLSTLASKTETLSACTNIHSLINKAIDIAVPLITPKIKFVTWWTKDLSTLRQTLRNHERISRQRQSDRTLSDKCQKLRQEWQSTIRTAKHSYWINKLETTDRDTIWKTISKKQIHKKPIPPIAGLVDFQSKANALRDGLFPDSAEPPNIPDNFVSSTNDLTQNFYPVTKREINICLRNLNSASALVGDKLTYGVVQHFNNSLPHALPGLFTAFFFFFSVHIAIMADGR
jgi:hypothetical protein